MFSASTFTYVLIWPLLDTNIPLRFYGTWRTPNSFYMGVTTLCACTVDYTADVHLGLNLDGRDYVSRCDSVASPPT